VGQRKYPPLTPNEVRSILTALGFVALPTRPTSGSHVQYERPAAQGRPRRVVTVDTAVGAFWEEIVKYMILQSGHSRDEFYGATRATARKIGLR
jgi:predicted RNA binding protein YcfA (HicA-like mRNA interferase family)